MNHYPHHLGDYAKDTMGLSLLEHGAYRLLIDAYYATERPIPPGLDAACRMVRAASKPERAAVDFVLKTYFHGDAHGWHHKRIDSEIAAYRAKSEKASKNAAARWDKPSGRNANASPPAEQTECRTITDSIAEAMLTSSHKPVASNQEPSDEQRLEPPGIPELSSAGRAAPLRTLEQQGRIPGGDGTPAAELAAVLKANSCRGNAFNPLVIEWAMKGITVERLKDAIAKARQRPGKESALIGPEYLNPILADEGKPVDNRWRTDDDAAVAKGRELGLEAKRGEDFYAFRQRIGEALSQRARRTVQ